MKVNDKFSTKKDAVLAIQEFLRDKHFVYDQVQFTPKSITFNCVGKKEFNCDAVVHSLFKKKENAFVIKKIKLNHKCPPDLKNVSSVDFIKNEIKKCGMNMRIGEIVHTLNRKNIKIGYRSVWKALNEDEDDVNAQDAFVREFVMLNSECRAIADTDSIFVLLPLIDYVRKIIEIKIVARKEGGHILYALVYDPHDNAQILSFMVTNDSSILSAKEHFFGYLGRYIDIGSTVFLCDLKDAYLFDKETYFIKVRSICREIYKKCRDRNMVVSVWNFCNSSTDQQEIDLLRETIHQFNSRVPESSETNNNMPNEASDETEHRNGMCYDKENNENVARSKEYRRSASTRMPAIKLSNYKKGDRMLYGLQNISDPDLDILYYNLTGDLIDITNTIVKLISEHNAQQRKEDMPYGENIKNKVERKIDVQYTITSAENGTYGVAIGNEVFSTCLSAMCCTCGLFQEYACPCTHALLLCRHLGLDPYTFVGRMFVYRKEIFMGITPVVNESLKQQNVQMLLRRGPGRPKKRSVKKYSDGMQ